MRVAVIGSTGYLGEQICHVLSTSPEFEVKLLVANRSWEKLIRQAQGFRNPSIYLVNRDANFRAASDLKESEIHVLKSRDAVREMILGDSVDGVFFALSGIDWIDLFCDLLVTKKTIWMATKEIIVAGSELWKEERDLSQHQNIIALDSEHNALHQLLQKQSKKDIAKIYLTASGGAFYEWQGDLNEITPEMALSHPNWKMGTKITIDSANLINKGLEVIEANCLFNFPYSQIDVLVQRESVIHALIERQDGFIIALLSKPDMKAVIRHALKSEGSLSWEEYKFDFCQLHQLHFDYPVPDRFRGFYLAVKVGQLGGGYPVFFCGANEACVQAFLSHRIGFNHIPILLEKTLEVTLSKPQTVSDVIEIYNQGYKAAKNLIQQRRSLKC
ncbi:MAG: hypothetical protein GX428_11630 [Candidatus Atribacteria bacterium]|nr:hypothetical protein [Candidatus Atribacteria bacterium]